MRLKAAGLVAFLAIVAGVLVACGMWHVALVITIALVVIAILAKAEEYHA